VKILDLKGILPLLAPYWEPLFGHGVSHQQRPSQTSWIMLARNDRAPEVTPPAKGRESDE
jgi:hypothetical protein